MQTYVLIPVNYFTLSIKKNLPCSLPHFYWLIRSPLSLTNGSLLGASPQEGREPGQWGSFNQLCSKGEEVRGKWGKARQVIGRQGGWLGWEGQLFRRWRSPKRSRGQWDWLLLGEKQELERHSPSSVARLGWSAEGAATPLLIIATNWVTTFVSTKGLSPGSHP